VRQRTVVVEEEEEQLPPQPYEFSYAAAGRSPGHIDRAHAESRDEFGVVRGESADLFNSSVNYFPWFLEYILLLHNLKIQDIN
jgi:hypothetical protein